MYKLLKDYDAESIVEIIDKELQFHLGSVDIGDMNITEILKGKITKVFLAGNYPNLPSTFEISDLAGNVREINVYEVKKVTE